MKKKQRKKLKSAKVNNNLRNILENRVILRTEGKTRNNCMSFEKNESIKLKKKFTNSNKDFENFFRKNKNNIFTKFNTYNNKGEEEKFAFHTSVKNKSFRNIKNYSEFKNKDRNTKRVKIGTKLQV